jgi:enoyl-CoA hydratase/carnithine racemase
VPDEGPRPTTSPTLPSLPEGLLLSEESAGVFHLVLDRPRQRNALTEAMMRAIGDVVATVNAAPHAAALVISGNGGAFCAGADRAVVRNRSSGDATWRWPELMGREAELLADCEVTTVAAITGPAVGLGMGLALACDITLMEPQAFFAEAHLALGLTPTAMCWWLPRMTGLARASDVVLTGRRVTGEEAVAVGMVSRRAATGAAVEDALALARELRDREPDMLRFAKLALRIAQDEHRMLEVRRLGGLTNRIHRANKAAREEPRES